MAENAESDTRPEADKDHQFFVTLDDLKDMEDDPLTDESYVTPVYIEYDSSHQIQQDHNEKEEEATIQNVLNSTQEAAGSNQSTFTEGTG